MQYKVEFGKPRLGDAVLPYTDTLVSLLRDENIKVRESALHALGRCDSAAGPHILLFTVLSAAEESEDKNAHAFKYIQ